MKNITEFKTFERKIQIVDTNKEWFDAVRNNDIEKVKSFIENGIDINAQDPYGLSALIISAYYGNLELVQLLLSTPNININAQDKYGETALTSAAIKGHREIVGLLLNAPGIDITLKTKYGEDALKLANTKGFKEIADMIIAKV